MRSSGPPCGPSSRAPVKATASFSGSVPVSECIEDSIMTIKTALRLSAAVAGTLAASAALTMLASAASPKFYDDDPVWQDRDTQDASQMKPLEVDLIVDLTSNMLRATAGVNVRAKNVNTVDEVPDSSWFTNRIGRHSEPALTPEDVAKG